MSDEPKRVMSISEGIMNNEKMRRWEDGRMGGWEDGRKLSPISNYLRQSRKKNKKLTL